MPQEGRRRRPDLLRRRSPFEAGQDCGSQPRARGLAAPGGKSLVRCFRLFNVWRSRSRAEVESKVGCFREMLHTEGSIEVRVEWAGLDGAIADEAVGAPLDGGWVGFGRMPHDYMSPLPSIRYLRPASAQRGGVDDVRAGEKSCVEMQSVGYGASARTVQEGGLVLNTARSSSGRVVGTSSRAGSSRRGGT